MSLIPNTRSNSNGGAFIADVDRYGGGPPLGLEGSWPQMLYRKDRAGSAGVVVLVTGYGPYYPYYGTSPSVADFRFTIRGGSAPTPADLAKSPKLSSLRVALTMSALDQAREVLTSLSINKTQLAGILGVSRPTLYEWLNGKEPNALNAQRLTRVLGVLAGLGVSRSNPLNARFVTQPLSEHSTSLLGVLSSENFDEALVSSLVREAKSLDEEVSARRMTREARLRTLGFDDVSDKQRREQLGRNIAMRDWPKP